MYTKIIKPLIDFTLALVTLLLTAPFFILIAILLAFVNKGNVFFIQQRPGMHHRIFKVIKFKTMTDFRDADGKLLEDEKRLTMIGKIVRKTSFDELPQLLNVLNGDMSIVGPRPLLTEYLPLFNQEQKRRHEVKPGITGWAQVNGRNAISWTQKFALDVWYVDHISFMLDMKILVLTAIKVFKAEGINSKTSITMEKFRGNG